jgi:hypothetical protein
MAVTRDALTSIYKMYYFTILRSYLFNTGPSFPYAIWNAAMIEDSKGGVVLIGGFSRASQYSDTTLYHLPHGGPDAGWTKMEQKLKTNRYTHSSIMIPDNVADCS